MPGPGGYGPAPQKSSNKGLWIGLGIGALVLALLCCGGLAIAVVNGINTAKDEINKIEASQDPLPTDAPSESPSDSATSDENSAGTVGTPIRMTDLEFTVTSKAACSSAPLGTGSNRAEPLRGQFCQIPIRLVNKGAEASRWPCIRATMTSAKEAKNYYSTAGHRAVSNGASCGVDLAPGATWDGKIVFDINEADTPQKIVFTEDYQGFAIVTL
jgi:hypothetical protein